MLDAPIGPLLAVVDGDGALVRLEFLPDADVATALARLAAASPGGPDRGAGAPEPARLGVDRLPGAPGGTVTRDPERLAAVAEGLAEYFAGRGDVLSLRVAPRGTAFQQAVWSALRAIPSGATSTYATIAEEIGRPRASRAAGQAIGANPVAIVIPCHRVVGSDGSLTGFGGGLPIKRRLLELEGVLAPGTLRVALPGRDPSGQAGQGSLFAATTAG